MLTPIREISGPCSAYRAPFPVARDSARDITLTYCGRLMGAGPAYLFKLHSPRRHEWFTVPTEEEAISKAHDLINGGR